MQRIDAKESVRLATTSPVVLSGLQTIDGVALAEGNRLLVKNQASTAQNGIYLASAAAWSRSPDAADILHVTPNLEVTVEEGLANASTRWMLVSDFPIDVGVTSLVFSQSSGPGLDRVQTDLFTPANGQTAFTLTRMPADPNDVRMYVNGLEQRKDADFTLAGQAVTWLNADFALDVLDEATFRYDL